MRPLRRSLLAVAGMLLASAAGAAPPRFTGFETAGDEVAVGRAERPAILEQFGGEAGSAAFRRYVAQLGEAMAHGVGRKDMPLSFTVLDSPLVTSFATPGGFVYLTRGLVELADSESELAAVLAHEIGHQAAQHYPRRDRRNLLANLRLAGLGGSGRALGKVLAVGAMPTFTHEEENDADTIAARLLGESGYGVEALARMLTKLRAEARLAAVLRGEDADATDAFGWLAVHPAGEGRMARVAELAQRDDGDARAPSRDAYLDQIDGLPFGAGPNRAQFEGRVFLDPKERVRFEVPTGFSLFALPHGAVAFGHRGARLVFDIVHDQPNTSAERHLAASLATKGEASTIEAIEIDGLEAATATARGRSDAGEADVRMVAIRGPGGAFYRFAFATPPEQTAALAPALRRATYSFRRLTEEEARDVRPQTLRVVTVGPGDTLERLAERMPFTDYRRERFAVLNGLSAGAPLAPGLRVKIVTAAPAPVP